MKKVPQTTSLPALLDKGTDRSFREIAELSWRCAQRMATINGLHAAQVGLSSSQYTIVMTLAYVPEGATVSALADRLGLSQPFVTREIGLLVGDGLVAKRANPSDGRSTLISLTSKGEAAAAKLAGKLQETNDILFEGVTAEQFAFLKGFADKVSMQAEIALLVAQQRYQQATREQSTPAVEPIRKPSVKRRPR